MPYKQQPKSPLMKALIGKQGNLNAGLRAAIEAAPESPAKMKGDLDKDGKMSGYETARQNAIEKAMAKSPAKKSGPGDKKKAVQNNLKGATVGAARQLLKEAGVNDPNISPSNVLKYAKQKGYLQEAKNMAKQGLKQKENNFTFGDSSKKKYL